MIMNMVTGRGRGSDPEDIVIHVWGQSRGHG